MKITITEKAKKEAREYADKIASLSLMNKPNYTGLNMPDRYYIGYLGEWVFSRFLLKQDLQFQWKTNTSGKSDDGDFIIKGKKIDVKTASKGGYKRMMTRVAQLYHYRDYYIGVRINGDEGEILGYSTHQDLVDSETKDFGRGPTKAIEFTDLKDINFLIQKLKDGDILQ